MEKKSSLRFKTWAFLPITFTIERNKNQIGSLSNPNSQLSTNKSDPSRTKASLGSGSWHDLGHLLKPKYLWAQGMLPFTSTYPRLPGARSQRFLLFLALWNENTETFPTDQTFDSLDSWLVGWIVPNFLGGKRYGTRISFSSIGKRPPCVCKYYYVSVFVLESKRNDEEFRSFWKQLPVGGVHSYGSFYSMGLFGSNEGEGVLRLISWNRLMAGHSIY